MTNAQSVQIRERTRQCFGLNLIEIFSKSLNIINDSFCNGNIKLGEIFNWM